MTKEQYDKATDYFRWIENYKSNIQNLEKVIKELEESEISPVWVTIRGEACPIDHKSAVRILKGRVKILSEGLEKTIKELEEI